MRVLVEECRKQSLKISVAESLTAGMFCEKIAEVENASAIFLGGIVAYARTTKETLLLIDPRLLDTYGMISKECAKAMVEGVQKQIPSDLAIAFTGNAGPSAWEGQPIGKVYTAIRYKGQTQVFEDDFEGTRNEIRQQVVTCGILRIKKIIGVVQ